MTLADIGQRLQARAAGTWRVEGTELVLDDFWAAPDLDPLVAEAFRIATLRVAISRSDLGIVGAALDARPRVSIALELSAGSGSGMWLHRFGAARSIAVPRITDGVVAGVASVALRDSRDIEAIRLLSAFLNS